MIAAEQRTNRHFALAGRIDRLDWEQDGKDWPNRESSRMIRVGNLVWHVQTFGHGPVLLLVHGTGASTHSWRDLMPLLTRHFMVLAVDLPGHGFTSMPPFSDLSLPGMARALGDLLKAMDVTPALAVGHSAGVAILVRMCLDGRIAPAGLISLNGALMPLRGVPGHLFAPVAKVLVSCPAVPQLFAWRASKEAVVQRLLNDTGSVLDSSGVELYRRLMESPGHVAAALGMMANWDLQPIRRDLRHLRLPLVLVTGGNDRTISPRDATRVKERTPFATIVKLPGLGHLAHEERPADIACVIDRYARLWRVMET